MNTSMTLRSLTTFFPRQPLQRSFALATLDRALLASLALALDADDVLLERQLGRLPLVEVLERDLDAVHDILALLGALGSSSSSPAKESPSAAKELREEILGVHAAHPAGSSTTVLESLLTVLVVDSSLVGAVSQERGGEGGGDWDEMRGEERSGE
jgi:hypothetical protein